MGQERDELALASVMKSPNGRPAEMPAFFYSGRREAWLRTRCRSVASIFHVRLHSMGTARPLDLPMAAISRLCPMQMSAAVAAHCASARLIP